LLKNFFPNRDVVRNPITNLEIVRWLKTLPKNVKADTTRKRLRHITWLYTTPSSYDLESPFAGLTNPAAGLKVRKDEYEASSDEADRTFSAQQSRAILETAARVRFGDTPREKRHTEVMWMLWLIAIEGVGPKEVSQLQAGDVYKTEEGIQGHSYSRHRRYNERAAQGKAREG
jgi:hypothetical protein